MNIVKVKPKENYQLLVHAENGLTGVFDVSSYLASEAFLPLRECLPGRAVWCLEFFAGCTDNAPPDAGIQGIERFQAGE